MNIKITPLIKGGITGVLMIIATLIIYQVNPLQQSALPYFIIYGLYVAGIVWTLLTYAQSNTYTGKFGDAFSEGFKCFIIVTLIIVIFSGINAQLHPELKEQYLDLYRQELTKTKGKLPSEIDTMVDNAKKGYLTGIIYSSIFGYLVFGALTTLIGSVVLIQLKKK